MPEQFITMEKLQCEVSAQFGVVLKFGTPTADYVIVSDYSYTNDFYAQVYKFIETPEKTGLDIIECRLNCIAQEKGFKDNGNAVLWGIEQITIF